MALVTLKTEGKMAIIKLDNGVTNPIGPELILELSTVLKQVKSECNGMVLAGGQKFFSIGFDLPRLLKLDRPDMSDFFYGFQQALLDLFTLPMPTICAIAGHAVAGGSILALGCDYRIAGHEKTKLGLNEVRLGIPVPYLADLILRNIVEDRIANDLLYRGEFLESSEAVGIGLVDDLFSNEMVEEEAVNRVSEMSSLPPEAFAAIKENRVEAIRIRYEKNFRVKNERFLELWFSPPTQRLLHEAGKKF